MRRVIGHSPPGAQAGKITDQLLAFSRGGKRLPGSRCEVQPRRRVGQMPPQPAGCARAARKWPGSVRCTRWTRSCVHPVRYWRPCFENRRLRSRRRYAPGPASNTYVPPCNATVRIRPNPGPGRSSAGWRRRRHSAIPRDGIQFQRRRCRPRLRQSEGPTHASRQHRCRDPLLGLARHARQPRTRLYVTLSAALPDGMDRRSRVGSYCFASPKCENSERERAHAASTSVVKEAPPLLVAF